MKKILFLCAALVAFGSAFGQTKEAEAFKKKIEKNATALSDAKKGVTVAPWIEKANILLDANSAYTGKLFQGLKADQIIPMIGQPQSTTTADLKDVKYNKLVYPTFDLYTNDQNVIAFWVVTAPVFDNGLTDAYEALVKAKSIDAKVFTGTGKGVAATDRLKADLQSTGMAMYNMGNSAAAAADFSLAVDAAKLTGVVDTAFMYYAGVAYFEANNIDKSVQMLELALNNGTDQNGMVYYYLSQCYMNQSNHEKAIEILQQGFKKYPGNSTLIASLINAYITAKKDPVDIVAVVKQAQRLDSTNVSLYLVESSVYNEIGDRENAYSALLKAQEVDSTYEGAFYNYGIMKILEAENVRKEADKIDVNDAKSYDAAMAHIVELQSQAIEKLEKAFELDKTNSNTVDLLRQLYFPRRDKEPAKYELYEQLHKQMAPAE